VLFRTARLCPLENATATAGVAVSRIDAGGLIVVVDFEVLKHVSLLYAVIGRQRSMARMIKVRNENWFFF